MHNDRIPPSSLEAEMAVLGAILVEPDLFEVVAEHVGSADFYAHVHETIFRTIAEMREANRPIEKIALAERLRDQKPSRLEEVGGISYLSALMETVQTADTAAYYAKIIREKSSLRQIIRIGEEAVNRGYADEDIGPLVVASDVSAKLEAAVLRGVPARPLWGANLVAEIVRDWQAERVRRLHTPWKAINGNVKGFGMRELTLWAGHPAQGKSVAIGNLADFTARIYGHLGMTAFWPLEMGRVKTIYRFLSQYTGIPAVRIEERDLTDIEMARVAGGLKMLGAIPLAMFDRKPMLDIPTLRIHLRKLKREHGLAAALIDHVGWFREVREASNASEVHTRQERIFQGLAEIAEELDIAVHCVMHLKRPSSMPVDGSFPRPTMLDLRGGGNPEGHAHNIILVWRPDPKEDPRKGAFIVEKARSGGEGTYFFDFSGAQSIWLDDRHDTMGDGGRWFTPAEPNFEALESLTALPRPPAETQEPAAFEEEGEFFEDETFPVERPAWLDDGGQD